MDRGTHNSHDLAALDRDSVHTYMLAFDITKSTLLKPEYFLDIPDSLFERVVTRIEEAAKEVKNSIIIDRKSLGDGCIFYFNSAALCLKSAFKIVSLFKEGDHGLGEEKLACRISLNYGSCVRKYDCIERREALFSRNIVPLARLEPIVRPNEIWCTNSFYVAATQDMNRPISNEYKFKNLGELDYAKGWGRGDVYAVYRNGGTEPPDLPLSIIVESCQQYEGVLHICFLKLSHKQHSAMNLEGHFSAPMFSDVSIYYIYGSYDAVVKFSSKREWNQDNLKKELTRKGIVKDKKGVCNLFIVKDPNNGSVSGPRVVIKHPPKHIKSFILLESTEFAKSESSKHEMVCRIKNSVSSEISYVSYYSASDAIILEIVMEPAGYYSLSNFIEIIEKIIGEGDVRIDNTTYMVHMWREPSSNGNENAGIDE